MLMADFVKCIQMSSCLQSASAIVKIQNFSGIFTIFFSFDFPGVHEVPIDFGEFAKPK